MEIPYILSEGNVQVIIFFFFNMNGISEFFGGMNLGRVGNENADEIGFGINKTIF